jgi:hypothetical protein
MPVKLRTECEAFHTAGSDRHARRASPATDGAEADDQSPLWGRKRSFLTAAGMSEMCHYRSFDAHRGTMTWRQGFDLNGEGTRRSAAPGTGLILFLGVDRSTPG